MNILRVLLMSLLGLCLRSLGQEISLSEIDVSGLPAISNGQVRFGDIDLDGDLDAVISGFDGVVAITRVFINDGANDFRVMPFKTTGIQNAQLRLTDFNNDRYLDFIVLGTDESDNQVFKVFKNLSGIDFEEYNTAIRTPVDGTFDVQDYNNDGLVDVFVTGILNGKLESRIYYFDGTKYQSSSNLFAGLTNSVVQSGFFSDDSWLDIIYSGINARNKPETIRLYQSDDEGFSLFQDVPLSEGFVHRAESHDFDGDGNGDLVILRNISEQQTETVIFYGTEEGFSKTPTLMQHSVQYSIANTWEAPDFKRTTLVLEDFDQDGDMDIIESYYYEARLLILINEGNRTFTSEIIDLSAAFDGSVPLLNYAFGDVDSDSDLDLLVTSQSSVIFTNENGVFNASNIRVPWIYGEMEFLNTSEGIKLFCHGEIHLDPGANPLIGNAVLKELGNEIVLDSDFFTPQGNQLSPISGYDIVDLTNDGYDDLVLCERDEEGANTWIIVFHEIAGVLIPIDSILIDAPRSGWPSIRVQDINADGSLDILYNSEISYTEGRENISELIAYLNIGGTYDSPIELQSLLTITRDGVLFPSRATVINSDKLNYPMIFNVGISQNRYSFESDVFVFNGSDFESIFRMPHASGGMDAFDIDFDGDLDLILHDDETRAGQINLLRNDGSGIFETQELAFPGNSSSLVISNDFDLDGKRELVFESVNEDAQPGIHIYKYHEESNSIELYKEFLPMGQTNVSFGDFNADGIRDIYVNGYSQESVIHDSFFINNSPSVNQKPSIPRGVKVSIDGNEAKFSWEAATDDFSATDISYHFELYADGVGVSPLLSDSSGARLSPGFKEPYFKPEMVINLDSGNYSFRVQSVDDQSLSSGFTSSVEFSIENKSSISDFELIEIGDLDYFKSNTYSSAIISAFFSNRGIWADLNNDGLPEFTVIGYGEGFQDGPLLIFKNEGSFSLALENQIELSTSIIVGSPQVADFDNDGFLDILVGKSIFHNVGNLDFRKIDLPINQDYPYPSSLVDINNDGYTDIQFGDRLLLNKKELVFISMEDFIKDNEALNLKKEITSWGDFNGDTYPDALINTTNGLKLFYNTKAGSVEYSGQTFVSPYEIIDFSFVDYDGDGQTEIFFYEGEDFFPTHSFYISDYSVEGGFETSKILEINEVYQSMTGSVLIDFDQDDFIDIITNTGHYYRGTREGLQREVFPFEEDFEEFEEMLILVDIDGDQDLDIQNGLKIYRNNKNDIKSTPGTPHSLQAKQADDNVVLTWDCEGNNSYLLEVYKDGNLFISDKNSFGKLNSKVLPGYAGQKKSMALNLSSGEYSVKVKAINNSYNVSSFSEPLTFSMSHFNSIAMDFFDGFQVIEIQSVDIDMDEDLDLVISMVSRLSDGSNGDWKNGFLINENGKFAFTPFPIGAAHPTNFDIEDINNDGRIDLVGNIQNGGKIFINKGDLGFDVYHFQKAGEVYAIGDLDGDRRKDVVVGENGSFEWYRQQGDGSFQFADIIAENAYNILDEAVLLDYDQDGDLDMFISGTSYFLGNAGDERFLVNDGAGNFVDIDLSLSLRSTIAPSQIEFTDISNDGIPDQIFRGIISSISIAEPNGEFEQIQDVIPATTGRFFSGDFDGDLDSDLIFTSDFRGESSRSFVENINGGAFLQFNIDLPYLTNSRFSMQGTRGDFDGDNKLDMILFAYDQFVNPITYFIQNKFSSSLKKPEPPLDLMVSTEGSEVLLSWDANTKVPITYGLTIIDEEGYKVLSQNSLENGTLLIPNHGNNGYLQSYSVSLPDGIYSWKVQSVSNGFVGSDFVEGGTFYICKEFESIGSGFGFSTLGSDKIGIDGSVQFVDTSSISISEYFWEFGDGSSSNDSTPTHNYRQPGFFTISVTIYDNLGCSYTYEKEVEVIEKPNIQIANILTPNNDGKNDYLYIENIERYPDNSVKIFGPSGNLVYAKTGYRNDWYADQNGRTLQPGTYLCILKVDQVSTEIRQSITILGGK
ncbi:MAG: VCBS repeat-containing protein [Cyclobacteriaceae bacterium]